LPKVAIRTGRKWRAVEREFGGCPRSLGGCPRSLPDLSPGGSDVQGSAPKDGVFGAAWVYTVAVPGPKRKSWFMALAVWLQCARPRSRSVNTSRPGGSNLCNAGLASLSIGDFSSKWIRTGLAVMHQSCCRVTPHHPLEFDRAPKYDRKKGFS